MKKTRPILLLMLVCLIHGVHAQCNAEHYYKIGSLTDMPQAKIIEDTVNKTTYAFWTGPVDTNCNNLSCDGNYEIWIQKNDACGKRIWKKNIGFSKDTSEDFFTDVLFTKDSGIIILGHGFYLDQGGLYSATIFKITKEGEVIWRRAYGAMDAFHPISIIYYPDHNSYLICGSMERRAPTGLLQRAYIMEIDSAGNKLNEKDILLNYDSITANKRHLKLDQVAIINDTTIVGLLGSDTFFFVQLNDKLELQWFKQVTTVAGGGGEWPIGGFDETTQEFITNVPQYANQAQTDSIWIGRIDKNGNYTSCIGIGTWRAPYGFGMNTPTQDKGYLSYGYMVYKLDSHYHITDTFRLPHIDDYDANNEYYGAPTLSYALQLKSGAYIGIGISGYRSNWDYAEVYILQTDKDGDFTPTFSPPNPIPSTIIILPNPSDDGIFTIKANNILYQNITVFNATGQLIYTVSNSPTTIDLSNQDNGLYFVSFQNKEGYNVYQQKILIQR